MKMMSSECIVVCIQITTIIHHGFKKTNKLPTVGSEFLNQKFCKMIVPKGDGNNTLNNKDDGPLLITNESTPLLPSSPAPTLARDALDNSVTRKPNSMKSSVFSAVCSTIGGGMLSVPYCFQQTGLVLGLAVLIVFQCLTIYSCRLLIVSARKVKPDASYVDAVVA
jgi:hypothetical protein